MTTLKMKTFNIVIASMFLLILMTSFASAEFSVSTTSLTFNEDTNTQTLTVTNLNESELLDVEFLSIVTIEGFSFEVTGNKTEINVSESRTFTVTSNDSNDFSSLDFGDFLSATFQIADALNASDNKTITINVEKTDFCEYSNLEELEIKSVSFDNNGKFGDDDEWYAFEEIEVTVEVKNDGRYDMIDIQLEWGLYDTEAREWIIEVDEEDSEFDLDRGDTYDDIVFTIRLDDDLDNLDLEDLTKGDNYIFYVRAIGEIDDEDSSHDGELTCDSKDEEIKFLEAKDFVIATNFQEIYDVSCGDTLTITADIWNIGTRNQDDVFVTLTNYQLGIYEEFELDELDSFEYEDLSFTIEIPEDIGEGMYELIFSVFDEDNNLYEVEDTETEFSVFVKVQGNCQVTPTIEVLAEADNLVEGKEGVVKVVITNLEDSVQTFDLDLASYSTWAEDAQLSSELIVIESGESKEIEITMKLKDDSMGTHTFELILTSDNGVETQPIEVEVLENKGFLGISGFATGGNIYTTGLTTLIIALVIIILVLLIIRKLRK